MLKKAMLKKALNKKGQISIDAVLAVMFLLIASTIIYHTVYNTVDNIKEVEIVDRVNTIADTFENYALTSYSKNVKITVKLEPVGVRSYTIYFGNKSIVVNTTRTITFIPNEEEDGVSVDTSQISDGVSNTGKNLSKVINITYGNNEFYVQRNISIKIN